MEINKIKLPFRLKKAVLALGAQAKNTVCLANGNFAYISRVHPDLNKPDDFLKFSKSVGYFLRKKPRIIACDLHPEYQSTKYAQQLLPVSGSIFLIQHHHAHVASCMAENGLKNEKVIGVAFDGTGLGHDHALWGGEFLLCDYKNFTRCASLKEVPLLGGERAISEPGRLAAFWLYTAYKDNFLKLDIDFVRRMDKNKWRVLKSMHEKNFNTPSTSSMGRLFDAVSSLVLSKDKAHFEAELAIELEKIATGYGLEAMGYEFKIIKQKDKYIIDPTVIFKGIVSDLRKNVTKAKIAYAFHFTVAQIIQKISLKISQKTGIKKVVLSGGVFQNKLLLKMSLGLLQQKNLCVFTHQKLSCNDSGLSLGQAMVGGVRN
ncbi:MAG: hypothetical protein A2166_06640 [Omnitrophica WOR_2 bacterium RBG_13_41_10]|nr:MAG: hypothetical protein A2166_06640 [Omnitrophica WOR_2 bacterium RBG_13_41_10]